MWIDHCAGLMTLATRFVVRNSPRDTGGDVLSFAPFQERVGNWLKACFPLAAQSDVVERTHRFLEEALELAQANGCTREDAVALIDYVYNRPSGVPDLEVGGVMVTLAALCSASNVSMTDAGELELMRNWDRIEAIRQKQMSRPIESPLPQ